MPRTATVSKQDDQHATFEQERLTLDDVMTVLETITESLNELREQQMEIVEKLVNLGLERDEYTGYRE